MRRLTLQADWQLWQGLDTTSTSIFCRESNEIAKSGPAFGIVPEMKIGSFCHRKTAGA